MHHVPFNCLFTSRDVLLYIIMLEWFQERYCYNIKNRQFNAEIKVIWCTLLRVFPKAYCFYRSSSFITLSHKFHVTLTLID